MGHAPAVHSWFAPDRPHSRAQQPPSSSWGGSVSLLLEITVRIPLSLLKGKARASALRASPLFSTGLAYFAIRILMRPQLAPWRVFKEIGNFGGRSPSIRKRAGRWLLRMLSTWAAGLVRAQSGVAVCCQKSDRAVAGLVCARSGVAVCCQKSDGAVAGLVCARSGVAVCCQKSDSDGAKVEFFRFVS